MCEGVVGENTGLRTRADGQDCVWVLGHPIHNRLLPNSGGPPEVVHWEPLLPPRQEEKGREPCGGVRVGIVGLDHFWKRLMPTGFPFPWLLGMYVGSLDRRSLIVALNLLHCPLACGWSGTLLYHTGRLSFVRGLIQSCDLGRCGAVEDCSLHWPGCQQLLPHPYHLQVCSLPLLLSQGWAEEGR